MPNLTEKEKIITHHATHLFHGDEGARASSQLTGDFYPSVLGGERKEALNNSNLTTTLCSQDFKGSVSTCPEDISQRLRVSPPPPQSKEQIERANSPESKPPGSDSQASSDETVFLSCNPAPQKAARGSIPSRGIAGATPAQNWFAQQECWDFPPTLPAPLILSR